MTIPEVEVIIPDSIFTVPTVNDDVIPTSSARDRVVVPSPLSVTSTSPLVPRIAVPVIVTVAIPDTPSVIVTPVPTKLSVVNPVPIGLPSS